MSTIFHAMTNFRRFFASHAQQMTLIPAKKKHEYRTHKLFIVTSGGCSNLSDKFYNCSVDIKGSSMAAEDVLESEEAHYLRRTCGRDTQDGGRRDGPVHSIYHGHVRIRSGSPR